MLCHSQLLYSLLKMPIMQDVLFHRFPPTSNSLQEFSYTFICPVSLCPNNWLSPPIPYGCHSNTAIKAQSLFQKVHLLEQRSKHKCPFPSHRQVPGWG